MLLEFDTRRCAVVSLTPDHVQCEDTYIAFTCACDPDWDGNGVCVCNLMEGIARSEETIVDIVTSKGVWRMELCSAAEARVFEECLQKAFERSVAHQTLVQFDAQFCGHIWRMMRAMTDVHPHLRREFRSAVVHGQMSVFDFISLPAYEVYFSGLEFPRVSRKIELIRSKLCADFLSKCAEMRDCFDKYTPATQGP
jgi:hypothetical protein